MCGILGKVFNTWNFDRKGMQACFIFIPPTRRGSISPISSAQEKKEKREKKEKKEKRRKREDSEEQSPPTAPTTAKPRKKRMAATQLGPSVAAKDLEEQFDEARAEALKAVQRVPIRTT